MDLTISEITGINPNIINGTLSLDSISIAQRMSWASARTTTREEDIAYCLMGIFDVNMPLLYGEGKRAFIRLQMEIMRDSDDQTLFAWKEPLATSDAPSGLLAAHPAAFSTSGRVMRYEDDEDQAPFSMTNKGLLITMELTPMPKDADFCAKLHCGDAQTGDQISIYLRKVSATSEQYVRVRSDVWGTCLSGTATKARSVYVKYFDVHTPIHAPLQHEGLEIRLLQVLPARKTTGVRCRLITAKHNGARYTALSYSWGNDHASQSIKVNNRAHDVRLPLYSFLWKMSRTLRDELFWVDAVCIDQRNISERNHQVRLMRQIYGSAATVTVWLPEGRTDAAMVDLFASNTEVTPAGIGATALEIVAGNPYWGRVWIVPEIMLAQTLRIECPSLIVPLRRWRDLYNEDRKQQQHLLGRTRSRLPYLPMDRLLHLLDSFKINAKDVASWTSRAETRTPRIKLELLLQAAYSSAAMHANDRVYAVSGISDLDGVLLTDYEDRPTDVFFSVVQCLGPDCTATIVPLLLQTLQLKDRDAATDQLDYHHNLSSQRRIWIAYHLPAYAACRLAETNDGLMEAISDEASESVSSFLTLHPIGDGGLLFARKSHNNFYAPSGLYHRQGSGKTIRIALPHGFMRQFTRTFGVLDGSDGSQPRLRIVADGRGVLALGYCLPWPEDDRPPVFNYLDTAVP